MSDAPISCSISAEGILFSCPVHIVLGSDNGKVMFSGTLDSEKRTLLQVLKSSNVSLSENAQEVINAILPDCCPDRLNLLYHKDSLVLSIKNQDICFKLAKTQDNTAVLFMIQKSDIETADTKTSLMSNIKVLLTEMADFFGISQLMIYAQTGQKTMLPFMTKNIVPIENIPVRFQESTLLIYSDVSFEGDSIFCTGIRSLFGLESAAFCLAMKSDILSAVINLPRIDTKYIKSRDLYIEVEAGKQLGFQIKGSFVFPYLNGMEFCLDCGVSQAQFKIEALAHTEKPIELFGPFAIGDTCLGIKAGASIELSLYTTLYIRRLSFFGAVILKEMAGAFYPALISASMSDISLSILADNLLGEHITGIEALDLIKIQGLFFEEMPRFSKEQIEEKDKSSITNQFNENVVSEFLRLDENQMQITLYDGGADLADLKRMRHYHISPDGKTELCAQFYYAAENTSIGNYKIEQGFFVCGVIEIMGKRFEALFSMRESEGILAYGKIPTIDLGFLKIDESEYNKKEKLPISKDSLLSQFLNNDKEGMVFYLSAGKDEVSFYFDGSIEILRLHRTDARILYMNRKISVDIHTCMYGMLNTSLHILVDYEDFLSGNFEFSFLIDTAGLTEKLNTVSDRIDRAVMKLRDKISNAKSEVDRAQRYVNELYSQIDVLDAKIAQCNREIANAGWWKKVFVAISKGAEIGVYEIAKAGIYVSIGLATTALEVAKGILTMAGSVSETLLNAANAVIKGAMSLFYINYIRLDAKASLKEQYFNAELDFIILGKNYKIQKQIGKKLLESDAAEAIAGTINEEIADDIGHIEDGTFRSAWRRYSYKSYTTEQNRRKLSDARTQLSSSMAMIESMQNIYADNMGVTLEEYNSLNLSLRYAMNDVESILQAGVQSGNVAELGTAMGGLKRSVAYQEKKGVFRENQLSDMKKLIAQYDTARTLYNDMLGSIKCVQGYQKKLDRHNAKMTEKSVGIKSNPGTEQMKEVLIQVENSMYDTFPVRMGGTDYINLSREHMIQQYFMEAEEKLDVKPDKNIVEMRSRSRKGNYHNRIG